MRKIEIDSQLGTSAGLCPTFSNTYITYTIYLAKYLQYYNIFEANLWITAPDTSFDWKH